MRNLPELDALLRHLPYPLDAVDRVGERFARWRESGDETAAHEVDLWTYCYVRRYFVVRFAREPSFRGSELEAVIDQAYRRIEDGRAGLDHPRRYARWVIVVCRNTYLNFVSRRRDLLRVDRIAEPIDESPDLETMHEAAGLLGAIRSAIDRLPAFLREVARLRVMDGLDYPELSERTGHDIPTTRAYVHRALSRMRKDPLLRTWLHEQ